MINNPEIYQSCQGVGVPDTLGLIVEVAGSVETIGVEVSVWVGDWVALAVSVGVKEGVFISGGVFDGKGGRLLGMVVVGVGVLDTSMVVVGVVNGI